MPTMTTWCSRGVSRRGRRWLSIRPGSTKSAAGSPPRCNGVCGPGAAGGRGRAGGRPLPSDGRAPRDRGDFYDVHGAAGDWLFALGDVCGKGVEAAALTGRTRQSIRTAAHFDRRPEVVLEALNSVLHEAESGQFVTVVCARVRPQPDGHADVDLAVAGHPAPIVLRADGRVEQLEVFGTAAGCAPRRVTAPPPCDSTAATPC